jgi:hypothetical protein
MLQRAFGTHSPPLRSFPQVIASMSHHHPSAAAALGTPDEEPQRDMMGFVSFLVKCSNFVCKYSNRACIKSFAK